MRNYSADNVDKYIESAPDKAKSLLRELRELVLKTVPGVEEKISWGVPFYRYRGLLGGFSVFTKHLSFGLVDVLSDEVVKKLEEKGYGVGKKTVQIRFDQKIPHDEIVMILRERMFKNEKVKK